MHIIEIPRKSIVGPLTKWVLYDLGNNQIDEGLTMEYIHYRVALLPAGVYYAYEFQSTDGGEMWEHSGCEHYEFELRKKWYGGIRMNLINSEQWPLTN